MAGGGSGAIIGALRVVIGADSAALDKGLKDAQTTLDKFGAVAGLAIKKLLPVLTGGAIAANIKGIIDEAEQLGKAAEKIGMPVEQLSALKFAAEMSDVSFESLTKSMLKLNKSMVDVATGGGDKAKAAFESLGISVIDANGQLKSNMAVLLEMADKYSVMADGAKKAALSLDIMGKKGGTELIPLLNQGSQAIQNWMDMAKRLGLVMDKEFVEKAKQFNDQIRLISAIIKGSWIRAVGEMLPQLVELAVGVVQLQEAFKKMSDAADGAGIHIPGISDALRELLGIVGGAIVSIEILSTLFLALKYAGASLSKGFDDTSSSFDKWQQLLGLAVDKMFNFNAEVKKVIDGIKAAAAAAGGANRSGEIELKGHTNALTDFLKNLEKKTGALKGDALAMGENAVVAERLKIVEEAIAVAEANHIPITQQLRDRINEVANAYTEWYVRGKLIPQLYEQTRTPLEQFQQQMDLLNMELAQGYINSDLYARGIGKAQQALVQADPYLQAFSSSLTSAFDQAIQGGKKFSEILTQLLKDLSRALANAAFKQLLLGGQGGGGGILGAIAGMFGGGGGGGGSGGIGHAAHGGTFTVGGPGGIDTQLAALRVSPGEQISVSGPGDTAMSGGMVVNYAPAIDARGADAAAVARLAQVMADDKKNLRATIRDEVNRYRASQPAAFR